MAILKELIDLLPSSTYGEFSKKLELALKAGKFVEKLSLNKNKSIDFDLMKLAIDCPNIHTLDLSNCAIKQKGLFWVSSNLKNLFLEHVDIPQNSTEYLPKNLEFIEIYQSPSLTSLCLSNQKKLKRLVISKINISSFKDVSETLKTLSISACNLTPNIIQQIPKSVTSLEFFSVNLSDDDLDDLPEDLISLRLEYCSNITDEGIAKLFRLRNLRNLSLSGCKQLTNAIAYNLPPNLHHLELPDCEHIMNVKAILTERGYSHFGSGNNLWIKKKTIINKLIDKLINISFFNFQSKKSNV